MGKEQKEAENALGYSQESGKKWLAAANTCHNEPSYSQENKKTFLATANTVIKNCSTF